MKHLTLTLMSLVVLASASFASFPATFTINNLGNPEFNGTYVAQDATAAYPVYVNQANPEHVLFSSGPPPGLPFIPPTWRFSKFPGYTGTGSLSGFPKEDFYLSSGQSFQPLVSPLVAIFATTGAGVSPVPGSSEAGFQAGAPTTPSNNLVQEQATKLNIGLTFQNGQWSPQ